jgi:uncharacterized membrane protein
MAELFKIVANMEPDKALAEITSIFGNLLKDLDEKTRERSLLNLLGKHEGDKVSSMAHL